MNSSDNKNVPYGFSTRRCTFYVPIGEPIVINCSNSTTDFEIKKELSYHLKQRYRAELWLSNTDTAKLWFKSKDISFTKMGTKDSSGKAKTSDINKFSDNGDRFFVTINSTRPESGIGVGASTAASNQGLAPDTENSESTNSNPVSPRG